MTDIYEAHLTTFLEAAETADPVERVLCAVNVLDELDGIGQDWEALLDLAVAALYAGGMKQAEIGELLGKTRQMASIRAAHGKKAKRSLEHVVAAARRAARARG